jgi:FtsP/CotA-like multicopper oxidase with cupredoxin domain
MKLVGVQYLFAITNLQQVSAKATWTHLFRVTNSVITLAESLPSHTQLYNTWPEERFRKNLPDLVSATVVKYNNESEASLLGPPIHVVAGDNLSVILQNEISAYNFGISLHFHGFGYSNAFEYAGAVGVSQCPLAKGESFAYNITVNETPGTYWYHTEAEAAGKLDEYDAVRGALIVHPKGSDALVNRINAPLQSGYNPFSYENERILFFQDIFVSSPAELYLQKVGNLVPPSSKSDEGFLVATSQWNFGTCNGKLREIINVEPNQKYKFRLINGGEHFALKFSISGFPLTIVAADSHPIEPYTVESLVLHVGERFDVEVHIHNMIESESFWMEADTLDSQMQGYQRGIRAIMRVSNNKQLITGEDVLDPSPKIKPSKTADKHVKVLNCYHADNCIPVTALRSSLPTRSTGSGAESGNGLQNDSEIHFVETHFQPAPLYAHFVRVDYSYWMQNDFHPSAMISREYRSSNSVHPHSVPLEVASNSSVIIVWRTTLLMDHPMHLHGHTVEVLDVSHPKRHVCNLALCELNQDYSTNTLDKIRALDRARKVDTAVKKDTFIIPAGGVVVTRLQTGTQGLWLAHGQMDIHRQDGMSFVLNVGDYQIPKLDEWLPNDFPSCNTSLIKTLQINPACECFVDKDRPHLVEMPDKYLCSRPHLCHDFSQVANLDSYLYDKGFRIQTAARDWQMPGFMLMFSFVLIVAVAFTLLALLPHIPRIQSMQKEGNEGPLSRFCNENMKRNSLLSSTADATPATTRSSISHRRSTIDFSVGSIFDGMSYIGTIRDVDEIENSDSDCDRRADTILPVASELEVRGHSSQRSIGRRRLSSVAASIEGRLDRALGSILVERFDEEDGTDGFSRGLDFIPDGYSVQGRLTFDPCDLDIVNGNSSFVKQTVYIFQQQLQMHFPTCCNIFRYLEVGGLALLTGQVFRQDLDEATEATIYEMFSLILFITITWTFTRMNSIIPLQHQWFKSIQIVHKNRRFSLPPVLFARLLVLLLCECLWPAAFCIICCPVMGLNNWLEVSKIALLISLNNLCYLSLGAACALVRSMHYGMILANMMSQMSILVSGVFAELPTSIEGLRKRSPFFLTIRGLMKCVFHRTDNFECVHGSSDIEGGVNRCFIEESLVMRQFFRRGIYDPSSGVASVIEECVALLVLMLCIHFFICMRCVFSFYRVDWHKLKRMKSRIKNHCKSSSVH